MNEIEEIPVKHEIKDKMVIIGFLTIILEILVASMFLFLYIFEKSKNSFNSDNSFPALNFLFEIYINTMMIFMDPIFWDLMIILFIFTFPIIIILIGLSLNKEFQETKRKLKEDRDFLDSLNNEKK